MKERRRLERFALRLRAEVETLCHDKRDGQRSIFFTRNISSDGAFFDSFTPFPKGARVKVRLVLERQHLRKLAGTFAEVKLNGTVLRSESTGMVIVFDKEYQMLAVSRI